MQKFLPNFLKNFTLTDKKNEDKKLKDYIYKEISRASTKNLLNILESDVDNIDDIKANALLSLAHTSFLSEVDDTKLITQYSNLILKFLYSKNEMLVKNALKLIIESSLSTGQNLSMDDSYTMNSSVNLYIEKVFMLLKDSNPTIIAWACYALCVIVVRIKKSDMIKLLFSKYEKLIINAALNDIWHKGWDKNYALTLITIV